MLKTYSHPKSFLRASEIELYINDQKLEVLKSDLANFAICCLAKGEANIKIVSKNNLVEDFSVHPLSLNISGQVDEHKSLCLVLQQAKNILVQMKGFPDLYIFIHDQQEIIPEDKNILVIREGQMIECACLDLEGYTGIHIQGGGILKGRITVKNKPGLSISGHGIFDGSYYLRANDGGIPSIILDQCPNARIEDITMVNPCGWMILLGKSDGTQVRRIKQMGKVVSSDGIDVVGSSNILIENCFLSNNDDCVVIKAFQVGVNNLNKTQVKGNHNVDNVLVRNCVFINGPAGNAMEIGHELSVQEIKNITFENIDVVSVHGHGAVFSIHNNDRALVKDVLFKDIRIEHCYDKLIDFRISKSRFSTDDERGNIKNVSLKNIEWNKSNFNDGYTVSMIAGWDNEHFIENVSIENFKIHGQPIQSIDELEISTRYAHNIKLIN